MLELASEYAVMSIYTGGGFIGHDALPVINLVNHQLRSSEMDFLGRWGMKGFFSQMDSIRSET